MDNLLEILTLLTLINSVVLLILVLWSYWIFERSKKQTRIESKITSASRKKAQEIVNQALARAGEYLDQEKGLEKSQLVGLKKSLDNIIRDNLTELQEIVLSAEEKASDSYEHLAKTAATQTEQMLLMVSENLNKELTVMLSDTRSKFNQDYQKTLQELAQYKQDKINSLDQQAEELIAKIAKKVLPESVSLTDHQQLVIQALEQAKKDGFSI